MKKLISALFIAALLSSCGGDSKPAATSSSETSNTSTTPATEVAEVEEEYDVMKDKGIGPVESIFLGKLKEDLAAQGKEEFKAKCSACHKAEKRFVGPEMAGILERRTPEWVMNMILNPEEMLEKDPLAKALFMEFNGQLMTNQQVTQEEARAMLEYFRTLDP